MNLEPRLSDVVERFERVLKQRNALLRSLGGELPTAQQRDEFVVWDDEFVVAGQELIAARERTLEPLAPVVAHFYESISGGRGSVTLAYEPSFDEDLASALRLAQRADYFRGHSTVGPHRDDMSIFLDGRDARRQASQGEQRSMALALLLAGDALVRERRSITPLLMLDDVFSELDPVRSSRLLSLLPVGQTLVTTASPIPHELDPAVVVDLTVPS